MADASSFVAAGDAHDADVLDEKGKRAQRLDVCGNENSMNLPASLHVNIQQSQAFKALYDIRTFDAVLSAIRDEVSHMEPWDASLRPSKAMMYMYKLFRSRLTVNQMRVMLKDETSAYVKAIGLTYLRFTLPPQQLWEWFEPLIDDKMDIIVDKKQTKKITIGKFARTLILDPKYFGEYYPMRMPEPVKRDLSSKIEEHDRAKRSASTHSDRGAGRSGDQRRGRSRSRDRYRRRHSRSRSRSRSHSRSRDSSRNYRRRRSRSRSPSRSRSRSPRRYRKRSRSRCRSQSRSSGAHRSRSPKRVRTERSPSPTTLSKFSSLTAAKFGGAPKPAQTNLAQLREMYSSGSAPSRATSRQDIDEEFFSIGRRNK